MQFVFGAIMMLYPAELGLRWCAAVEDVKQTMEEVGQRLTLK